MFRLLLLLMIVASAQSEHVTSLNCLDWTLTSSALPNISVKGSVPGGVYSDLKKAGVLTAGDLIYRDNDLTYRWVAKTNWTYSALLKLNDGSEDTSNARVGLEFDGIDTVSAVALNGVVIGTTDNMFTKYYFDIPEADKSGDPPLLSVHLVSPVVWAAAQSARQAQHYPVPPSCVPPEYHGECHANHIRKMQASFGWDWGPAFPSMGIWRSARLVQWSTAYITDLLPSLSSDAPFPSVPDGAFKPAWNASIKVFLRLAYLDAPLTGEFLVRLDDIVNATFSAQLTPSELELSVVTLNFTIDEGLVELWWPAGLGQQRLYDLNVTWISQSPSLSRETSTKSVTVGFRTVQLDQSFVDPVNETLGRHYRVLVNNVMVFLRGSNWVPAEVTPERITSTYINRLLKDAVAANQNIIRVWGGGVYEANAFYETADKLGLLVWQDLMFACSMYPVSSDFLSSVRQEVRTQVLRLAHHASLALWASNNENEAALRGDWYGTAANFGLYQKDYVTLYVDTARTVTQELDPSRVFVVSSPSNGLRSEQEGYVAQNPYSNNFGDVHFYNYLKNGWDWRIYPASRMVSEYGYQSWPSFRTMATVTNASDWTISSDQMSYRQHHPFGNTELNMQIRTHLEFPDSGNPLVDYKHYLYLTQVHQAMAMRVQTETYRRRRSTLLEGGEGLTKYGGRWKMLHYYSKNFFSPILVSPYIDGTQIHVWVINDTPEPSAEVTLALELRSYSSFQSLSRTSLQLDSIAAQNASEVWVLDVYRDLKVEQLCHDWLYASLDTCFITFTAQDAQGQPVAPSTFLLLGEPNNAQLKYASVQVTGVHAVSSENQTYLVSLTTDEVALFVFLETDVAGVFSENGFVMFESAMTVTFEARRPTSSDELVGSIEITTLTHTADTSTAWRRYWRRWLTRNAT
ncbi:hypothetical protein HAZT_HAZT000623 [Hyalella azteca]|uniref:beta-mannosidase n=1 Tax=Hyalella azteca TaxID=294128 RepID=A0A6A0H8P3_HYAAZ|nr:hypothetical protein HAZT_HAZT000623 [Hyalella azteca]